MRKSGVFIGSVLALSVWGAACGSAFGPESFDASSQVAGADAGNLPDGNAPPDAGANSGGDLRLELACLTLNGARCDYLQRCGLVAPGTESRSDCMNLLGATDCGPTLWPARVIERTLNYHPVAAQQCADAYLTRACGEWRELPAVCSGVTTPAVSLGGRCYGGTAPECRSGTCTGGTCPRRCREQGGPGELCDVDADCRTGNFCQALGSGTGVGTCAALGTSGAICTTQAQCADGLYCSGLQRCAEFASEGESCLQAACAPGLWCSTAAGTVCIARAQADGACTADAQCEQGLWCAPESGTCQPAVTRAEGVSCTRARECGEPFTCLEGADGGACGPRRQDGSTCSSDRDCTVLSRCIDATCTPLPRTGEPCTPGGCLHGTCELTEGEWLCKGQGGPNAACTADAECASGRCVAGACLAACSP